MKLGTTEEVEIVKRISQTNNEKVILKSTVVIVGVLATLFLAGLVLLWAYISPGMVQFRDVLTTLLVGFGCTTLFYTSKTFQHNRDVNIYRIHLDVTKAERDASSSERKSEYQAKLFAFELMKDWHSGDMIYHAGVVRVLFEDLPSNMAQYLADPEHRQQRQSVMVLFNYFERVALAIQTKMADEPLLKRYFRGLFDAYYVKLESYIRARQNGGNHRLFVEYESTVLEWRKS